VIPFVKSDAWLFMAVATGDRGGGATLKDVIAAGDFINHSIFNAGELRRGLAKLTTGGFVREEAGRFSLTADGRALYGRAHDNRPKTPLAVWDALNDVLGVSLAPDPTAFDDDLWAYPSVKASDVRAAYDQYDREFRAAYERRYGKR
jgi:hypothetical protein